jgi:hypothetical protein
MGSRGSASITRRHPAHPFGFIADIELIRGSLISAFGPSPSTSQGTMPSADFWLLTQYVAIQGAAGFVMSRCLLRGSLRDSYPSTANGHAGFLVHRVNPFRTLLMTLLPHGNQISPDKDVNFPCTTAAFTLSHEPAGFVVLCQPAYRQAGSPRS